MTMSAVSYSFYKPGDENKIVKLLDNTFHGWPRFDIECSQVDHWRWKYLDNPIHKMSVFTAYLEDQLVGVNHSVFKKLFFNNQVYYTAHGADACVDSDYRQLGVFNTLKNMKVENEVKMGIKLYSMIGNNPILLDRHNRLGDLFFPHDLGNYIFINDIDGFVYKYKINRSEIVSALYKIYKFINRNKINFESIALNENIVTLEEFNDDVDVFWNKVKSNYLFSIIRGSEYLNWRYCDKRSGDFKILVYYEDDLIKGYIVNRINKNDEEYYEGYVVDYMYLPDREDVLACLMEASLKYFYENEVNSIRFICINNRSIKSLVESKGFIDLDKKYTPKWRLVFDKNYISKEEYKMISNSDTNMLHFTYGDHDWI